MDNTIALNYKIIDKIIDKKDILNLVDQGYTLCYIADKYNIALKALHNVLFKLRRIDKEFYNNYKCARSKHLLNRRLSLADQILQQAEMVPNLTIMSKNLGISRATLHTSIKFLKQDPEFNRKFKIARSKGKNKK